MKQLTPGEFVQIFTSNPPEMRAFEVSEHVESELLPDHYCKFENAHFDSLLLKGMAGRVRTLEFKNCTAKSIILSFTGSYLLFDTCQIGTLIVDGHIDEIRIAIDKPNAANSYKAIVIDAKKLPSTRLFIGDAEIEKLTTAGHYNTIEIDRSSINSLTASCNTNKLRLENIEDGSTYRLGKSFSSEEVVLKSCSLGEFNIDRAKIGVLDIYAGFIEKVILRPSSCKKVTIKGVSFFDESFGEHHPNCRFDSIELWNWRDVKETSFHFSYLKLKRFSAHEVDFLNGALFNNITITDEFTISDTTLVKCRFNKLRLYSCNVSLFDTFLQDCDFVNVIWPERHLINENVDSPRQYRSIREVYRQLKKVSLAQNDKISALEFQTNEMRMHYLHLKTKQNKTVTDHCDFLIVGTHKWASDFGQNIWRPVVLLFAFHLVLFTILSVSKLNIRPTLTNIDWELSAEMADQYFTTLLPTHSSELTVSDRKYSIQGCVDFLIRIFSGYFIFYFIYSSRKYHQ